jgi:hypothetical protein
MAAVVCLRQKKERLGTDEYFVMEVVDGQQRLTTEILSKVVFGGSRAYPDFDGSCGLG